MRRVHATSLPWKSSKYYIFCECVCSLRYPACIGHAPYCRLWPAPLYNIFHIISKTARLKKNCLSYNVCLEFCLTYCYPQKK